MYFRNYRLWKNWLEHSLKSTVSEQALGVNTFTAHDKYPVPKSENLPLPIQMKLSAKQKTFSQFFVSFLESTSNFKRFERKDDRYS